MDDLDNLDNFTFGMMPFMPGLDMADVAFWDDTTPDYEEPPRVFEVDDRGDTSSEERKPIEEDWVKEEEEEARSVAAGFSGHDDTMAPSSRHPGYAEE